MLDERLTLSPGMADEIVAVAREGADQAVRALFAKRQAEAKAALIIQQKQKLNTKLPNDGEVRTEIYPIKVTHTGNAYGVSTQISMDGCDLYFRVEQVTWRPARQPHGRKLNYTPLWNIRLYNSNDSNPLTVEDTENLEAAVQQCIVALLGNVWYGHR